MTGITAQPHSSLQTAQKLPLWKNLVDIASLWEYGSFHSHEEIANLLSIRYGTYEYRTVISRANEELTFIGKRLKNVKGEGYEVLEPENYLSESVGHVQKAARQIRKSYNIAAGCRVDLVAPHKRQELVEFRDWVKTRFVEGVSDVSNWIHIAKHSEQIPTLPRRE